MSDDGLTSDISEQPAAPEPDMLGGELPADQAMFTRGYVEKVRGEAQRYRGEASNASAALAAYDEVFGIYPDEDRQVWFQLARDWAQDPARAAAVMQQIAAGVLGETPTEEAPVSTDPPSSMPAEVLTAEQIQALIDEQFAQRDASAQEQQAIGEVFAEVRAAGFDPETAEGFSVLYNANHFTNGDIPAAVQMVRDNEQRIIDEFVAGRRGRPMTSPQGGVTATPNAEPIKNLDDARRATEAFLRERQSAS